MSELPLPPSFDPGRVGAVWAVAYGERAQEAEAWARRHGIRAAAGDERRICLLCVDCQNTFCAPGFELFVGGRSGRGEQLHGSHICSAPQGGVKRLGARAPGAAAQLPASLAWISGAVQRPP